MRWSPTTRTAGTSLGERYRCKLDDRSERIRELLEYARTGTLTLFYAVADEEHSNAVVFADYLAECLNEG